MLRSKALGDMSTRLAWRLVPECRRQGLSLDCLICAEFAPQRFILVTIITHCSCTDAELESVREHVDAAGVGHHLRSQLRALLECFAFVETACFVTKEVIQNITAAQNLNPEQGFQLLNPDPPRRC